MQVSRWGLPLITNIFMPEQGMREDYNRAIPCGDVPRFSNEIAKVVEKATRLAGSVANPAAYAKQFVARVCLTTLPYVLDSEAAFSFAGFNGRGLSDDVMDVILTLLTNTALGDGVAPDKSRIRSDFPYFGEPYKHSDKIASPEAK